MNDANLTNPYKSSSWRLDEECAMQSPLLSGLRHGMIAGTLAVVVTVLLCGFLTIVAKFIDFLIPGYGSLSGLSIVSIFIDNLNVFVIVTLLAGFTVFAHIGGAKRINAGVCALIVFAAGATTALVLSNLGYGSNRNLKALHPPIYLIEFLTYFIPYSITSFILAFIGRMRNDPQSKPKLSNGTEQNDAFKPDLRGFPDG